MTLIPFRLGKRSIVIADQMASSLTNLIPAVYAAHVLSPDAFGTFALLQATYVLLIGATRSAIVETALVSGPDPAQSRYSRALSAAIVAVTPLSLVSIAVVVVIGDAQLSGICIAMALLVFQDVQRISNISLGRPSSALVSDVTWLGASTVGMGLLHAADGISSYNALFLTWALTSGIGILVAERFRAHEVQVRSGARFVLAETATSSAHAIDWALRQGLTQAALYTVAAMASISSLGAIRLAQLMLGPANVLFAALQLAGMGGIARAKQEGAQALRREVIILSRNQVLLAVALGGIIILLPVHIYVAIFGGGAADLKKYLLPLIVLLAVSAPAASAQIGLKVLRLRSKLLFTRGATCALTLIVGLCALIYSYSPLSALWGLAAGSTGSACVWFAVFLRQHHHADHRGVLRVPSDRCEDISATRQHSSAR